MEIAIVGAGLAGLTAAWALRQRGQDGIHIIDRAAGPGLETSFANGALLHPSYPEPWNSPGVFTDLLRNLGNEEAAALLRLRALPSLLGWGLRFVRESTPARYRANSLANLALALHSQRCMERVRATGLEYGHAASGSVTVFRNARLRDQSLQWVQSLQAAGRRHVVWDVATLLQREPALEPIAADLVGAIYNPDDCRGDAYAFCVALTQQLQQQGVQFHWNTSVRALALETGRVVGWVDNGGRTQRAEWVVLAAASDSPLLARSAGLDLPLRPAKGYSLTLPLPPTAAPRPRLPVLDAELHAAIVPVGEDRLRIAGTAEFTGYDRHIAPRRVANLERLLGRVYPTVLAATPPAQRVPWTGLRPMVCDGVPLIGRTRLPGLALHTGHGHLGWTQAAGSGDLLADVLLQRPPALDAQPYAPARFGL